MAMKWWNKEVLSDKMPFLRARNLAKNAIRQYFLDDGFTEVETAELQVSPGNEVHLLGLSTIWTSPELNSHELFFATSPEFSCKKLIAGGMERIFEFARVFRNRDLSPTHSPEFTMLEWYRANQDWNVTIQDTLNLCKAAAIANNSHEYRYGKLVIPIDVKPRRLTLQEAFLQYANIDMLATVFPDGTTDRDLFAKLALEIGITINDDDDWSDIFTKVLVAKIDPNLGIAEPTILCEYPLPEGALAQKCQHDKRVVERFELYICGVEIANGFGELTNATEQRARFEDAMIRQKEIYGKAFPIDEDLLEALELMPPTSGVALGFERLVMLISGARRINDVLWTPFEKPKI